MYPQHGAPMAPPQKPETFMLSSEAQQSLPHDAQVQLQQVDNLKYFLLSAPVDWQPDQLIRRFLLPTGDYVSCVLWSNLFHISGTDIVRCLAFRFQAFGRPVKNTKKFEEGIFSDLRNLKAGTDATLEEPKSPFLDFLYKNNCIRTQKKQKVFYWYSVPHDRLFLDALERDLKREKMGQEATTVAVSEPALSFEFDSSQSLYEQLTKAQQANSSSFAAHASTTYGQSTSPVVRTVDAMPPPQMASQMASQMAPQMAPPSIPLLTDESANPQMYTSIPMPSTLAQNVIKREADYGALQYDRNGMPIARIHQRHSSMPTFVEYSPAPSFVSSQYEDYSNRGLSFEPVTPPQHTSHMGAEPAYIANEDTGLYTAIPEMSAGSGFNPMMHLPPSNLASAHFPTPARTFHSNVYSVLEGSPTYKQRRRRSSIPPGAANPVTTGTHSPAPAISYAAHKPSDLRRSVSSSVAPGEGDDSRHDSLHRSYTGGYPSAALPQKNLLHEMSRNTTPLSNVDENREQSAVPLVAQAPDDLSALPTNGTMESAVQNSVGHRGDRYATGPVRRARSATMMELDPYPQKSHSCPIPSCGRLFKRLEHLKRHVRTHTQERPYPCPYCNKAFSRSDNLAQHRRIHEAQQDGQPLVHDEDLENEDDESLSQDEEESASESTHHAVAGVHGVTSMPTSMPSTMALPNTMGTMMPPHMIAPQLLQQQI